MRQVPAFQMFGRTGPGRWRRFAPAGPTIYEISWAGRGLTDSEAAPDWNDRWSTSAGYSRNDVTNSDGQSPSAYKSGQYASVNLLCTPVKNTTITGEFQWARRENFSDGFRVSAVRLQFTFKYSFSSKVRG